MKRESCVKLLKILTKNKIEIDSNTISINGLLNLPEDLVSKITEVTDGYRQYRILCYLKKYEENLIDSEKTKKGIEIIAGCKTKFQIQYSTLVLSCDKAINVGIALEGAEIVASCQNAWQAEWCQKVLTNGIAINAEIAIEGAKIIAGCTEEWQAKACYTVLTNEEAVKAGIAIEGAKIIAGCKNEFQATNCCLVLITGHTINMGIALVGSQAIANCKSASQSMYCCKLLTSKTLFVNKTIEAVKIMSDCEEDWKVKACYDVFTDDNVRELGISIEMVEIVASCTEEWQAKAIIDLLNIANEAKLGKTATLVGVREIFCCEEFQVDYILNLYKSKKSMKLEERTNILTFARALNSEEITKISELFRTENTTEIISTLEEMTGLQVLECNNIDSLTLEETLALVSEEQFSMPEEITGKSVKEFVKTNKGNRYLIKNGN